MSNSVSNVDYTNRDYDAFRNMMIAKLQEKIPEYTDTSETDAGIVIIEALANGLDILSMYLDIIANDLFLPTTQSRKTALMLAKTLGYVPYERTASEYKQVFVLTALRDVSTVIPKGTLVKVPNNYDGEETLYYETQENLTIPSNHLGDEKTGNEYNYTVTVKSGRTISDDVIGSSNGSAFQTFQCTYSGVILDTLKVYVDEGNGEELWSKVDTFYNTDGNSKVYIVSVDENDVCRITFGNNYNGKIPQMLSNNISATYMIGGGAKSNVSNNTITTLETGIAFVGSTFNVGCLTVAHDKEDIDSIKLNAPTHFIAQDRLITLGDYNSLLKSSFPQFRNIMTLNDNTEPLELSINYHMKYGYTFTTALENELDEFIGERQIAGVTYEFKECSQQTVTGDIKIYLKHNYSEPSDFNTSLNSFVTDYFSELDVGESVIKNDLEDSIKNNFECVRTVAVNGVDDIISPSNSHTLLVNGLTLHSIINT